ncbi:MAG: CPBP family intramembrane metalloprotease [Oscillospiraceae bacterium]|nr:CPBP family intramembrane metalloprotease [Oscillospiraceae bacterium]
MNETSGFTSGFVFPCLKSYIWSVGAVLPVVIQVLNATAIGLFFAALFLRTGTLWIPILVHMLINFASMVFNAIISPDVLQQMNQTQNEPNIIGSIIGVAIIGLPFLTAGLIMLRKVNPDTISFY